MKHRNSNLLIVFILSLTLVNCSKNSLKSNDTGSVRGTVKDNSGTLLYGDINSNNIIIKMLGTGDQQATDIRVKGDGTYQNTKMFPKLYKVWAEGPIMKSDTIAIDLSNESSLVKDFVVTPLVSPKVMNGVVAGTTIKVDYSMVANGNNTVDKKEIYCSTVQFPTASIGSLTNVYFTKTVLLPSLSGTVTIDGLTAGTKYYIRSGVKANTSVIMNYSNQVEVTIP